MTNAFGIVLYTLGIWAYGSLYASVPLIFITPECPDVTNNIRWSLVWMIFINLAMSKFIHSNSWFVTVKSYRQMYKMIPIPIVDLVLNVCIYVLTEVRSTAILWFTVVILAVDCIFCTSMLDLKYRRSE